MTRLDDVRAALALAEALNEQDETPTRGASAGSTGTTGPQSGQAAKDPTTLADVTEPVGSTEPKLDAAMRRFQGGMEAIRSEVTAMVTAFEKAAPETRRGRGVASVIRVLKGLLPMVASAEEVAARALGESAYRFGDGAYAMDLAAVLDEEPLTHTTDADRASEPRKPVDAKTRAAVAQVGKDLGTIRERVRELGYRLQAAVETASRPDAVRASVTDLSEADTVLETVRQKIVARFK